MANPLNQQNFLQWYDLDPFVGNNPLPKPYRRDEGGAGYTPWIYPTEATAFYVNSPVGINYTPFSDLRLDLVNATTNLVHAADIGPLEQHFISDTHYNLHCTFVNPPAPTGLYYYRITRIASGVPIMYSNYVWVENDLEVVNRNTAFVRFRHDRHFYGVNYHEIPSFYQQFRLHINVAEDGPDEEVEVYKEVTTGKPRTLQTHLDWIVKLETYHFDDRAHQAAAILFSHYFVEINGKEYRRKSAYKKETSQLSVYAKGSIEMYDIEFSSVNRC